MFREKMFEKDLEYILVRVREIDEHPYPDVQTLVEHLEARYLEVTFVVRRKHPYILPSIQKRKLAITKQGWQNTFVAATDEPVIVIDNDEIITDAVLTRYMGFGPKGCDVIAFTISAIGRVFVYELPLVLEHDKQPV
jgi:hypothetical protein